MGVASLFSPSSSAYSSSYRAFRQGLMTMDLECLASVTADHLWATYSPNDSWKISSFAASRF